MAVETSKLQVLTRVTGELGRISAILTNAGQMTPDAETDGRAAYDEMVNGAKIALRNHANRLDNAMYTPTGTGTGNNGGVPVATVFTQIAFTEARPGVTSAAIVFEGDTYDLGYTGAQESKAVQIDVAGMGGTRKLATLTLMEGATVAQTVLFDLIIPESANTEEIDAFVDVDSDGPSNYQGAAAVHVVGT